MLILIVAVTIVSSLVIEHVVQLFANNYEIEWAVHTDREGATSAQEIISAMRKTHRESERQMNTAFKVASDGR